MRDLMTIEDIEKESRNANITANELDVLVAKTRELSSIREQEIKKLDRLHQELQERLKSIDAQDR